MSIRSIPAAFAAVALSLVVALPAAAAVKTGVYHGTAKGVPVTQCKTNEGEGYFRVKRVKGALRIVAPGSFTYTEGPAVCHSAAQVDHIIAPSNFKCNALNANVPAKSIKLKSGAFDWSGKAPIGPGGSSRHLRFKGHWDSGRFKGYTRISGAGCNSGKIRWTMRRL